VVLSCGGHSSSVMCAAIFRADLAKRPFLRLEVNREQRGIIPRQKDSKVQARQGVNVRLRVMTRVKVKVRV
jgi:hypothetical protein